MVSNNAAPVPHLQLISLGTAPNSIAKLGMIRLPYLKILRVKVKNRSTSECGGAALTTIITNINRITLDLYLLSEGVGDAAYRACSYDSYI